MIIDMTIYCITSMITPLNSSTKKGRSPYRCHGRSCGDGGIDGYVRWPWSKRTNPTSDKSFVCNSSVKLARCCRLGWMFKRCIRPKTTLHIRGRGKGKQRVGNPGVGNWWSVRYTDRKYPTQHDTVILYRFENKNKRLESNNNFSASLSFLSMTVSS